MQGIRSWQKILISLLTTTTTTSKCCMQNASQSTSRTHMRQIFGRFVLLWRRRSSVQAERCSLICEEWPAPESELCTPVYPWAPLVSARQTNLAVARAAIRWKSERRDARLLPWASDYDHVLKEMPLAIVGAPIHQSVVFFSKLINMYESLCCAELCRAVRCPRLGPAAQLQLQVVSLSFLVEIK